MTNLPHWMQARSAPVQESEKRECMNCAAFGECNPNNDAGRCGYEPPAAPVQEPVGEVVVESMGVRGSDAMQVRIHFYKEIPPVGSKVYTTPPAAQPAPVQEPVKAWCETCEGSGKVYQEHQIGCFVGGEHDCPDCDGKGFYTTPPAAQRPWVGLTDEEILEAAGIDGADTWIFETAYAIEAKLKEKNT